MLPGVMGFSIVNVEIGDEKHKGQHHRGSVAAGDKGDHPFANVCRSYSDG